MWSVICVSGSHMASNVRVGWKMDPFERKESIHVFVSRLEIAHTFPRSNSVDLFDYK